MINERINRQRHIEGMSLTELSAISGISRYKLQAFELGSETPDSIELVKLGRALGVNTHYFFQPNFDNERGL
jgi:transcriptional regulator with XRE-family HTH domain